MTAYSTLGGMVGYADRGILYNMPQDHGPPFTPYYRHRKTKGTMTVNVHTKNKEPILVQILGNAVVCFSAELEL